AAPEDLQRAIQGAAKEHVEERESRMDLDHPASGGSHALGETRKPATVDDSPAAPPAVAASGPPVVAGPPLDDALQQVMQSAKAAFTAVEGAFKAVEGAFKAAEDAIRQVGAALQANSVKPQVQPPAQSAVVPAAPSTPKG